MGALRGLFGKSHRPRVPVVLQLNAVECGAACLAMILNYHGRKTSMAECRERCGLGKDAVTAKMIAEAAREYGLRVKGFSIEPSQFDQIPLPAIVHWEFRHFLVVERWTSTHVEVIDPAVGRCRLTAAEFDAGFTGVILTFERGVNFDRRGPVIQSTWRTYLLSMFDTPGTKGLLAQILTASLCLLILGLALPLFTQIIVDRVLPFHLNQALTTIGFGLCVFVLAQAVANYLRSVLLIYLQAQMDSRMMLGFFERLLALPFRFFQQRSSGDLLMRLGSNTFIREILTNQTISTFLDGTLVLIYIVIITGRAPWFGMLLFLIGVLQFALLAGTRRKMQDVTHRDLAARAQSESYLVEALAGVSTIKAAGIEHLVLDHWSNLFLNELKASLQRNHVSTLVETVKELLHTLLPIALLWMGALEVLKGAMSLGTMLALTALAAAFLAPFSSLVSNLQRMQMVGAHLERLNDVAAAEPEQDANPVRRAPTLHGHIEVRNLSFRYAPALPPALREISFVITPGQKIGVVGRTGSGKSTLMKLLLALYLADEGEILYDGKPLESMNYRMLRSQLGVVLQEPFLFSGSIRENIAFAEPSLAFDRIVEAAQLAGIHDEIDQMPMKYETRIAEGGNGLSGGQRQRLALARALVRRPSILLLDEATSHLDMLTESLIEDNLSRLTCTRIVIAHRLSTVRNSDQIFVFEAGTIVESGTHEFLRTLGGPYASLIRNQVGSETAHSGKP